MLSLVMKLIMIYYGVGGERNVSCGFKRGEKATIMDLSKVNGIVKRRLLDFGIMEGEEILLKNRMPFRGPFVLDHSGQCLGIRYREAAHIGIEQV